MTPELTEEFESAVASIRRDQEVRAVVITGRGQAFCAGGDLSSLERQLSWSESENERYMASFYRKYLGVLEIEVPVIAAINGAAIGAGLSVALACDIRLAAESARMGFTFVNLGLHPGMATLHLLPLIVGHGRASELVLSGKVIDATEAMRIGLVDRVVPADALQTDALDLARSIARKPGTAARTAKRVLAAGKRSGLDESLDVDAKVQARDFGSAPTRAAIAALRARS